MPRPKSTPDYSQTVPERNFYTWESEATIKTYKARNMLQNRIRNSSGKTYEAFYKTLEALDKAWQKHGFTELSTKKLKALLVAAAQDVGWYKSNEYHQYKRPEQPDDPNMRACISCYEVKPLSHFTRKPSKALARKYGWREDTTIQTPHTKCNVCASVKRNSLAAKLTSPTIAKLRQQITEKLQVARKMPDCLYREKKIELLLRCRLQVEDYLERKVRGPDSWEMMLSKQEKEELEALHRRVHWTRRVPAVF